MKTQPRCSRSAAALAVAIGMSALVVTMHGQAPAASPRNAGSASYKVPRTPDGRPDLQGVWSNNSITPLQRPKQWADKKFLTDQELSDLKRATAEVVEGGGDAVFGDGLVLAALDKLKNPISYDPGTGNYNHFWMVERDVEDRRTSLIVDPPDGLLPPTTEAARQRQEEQTRQREQSPSDNPEDRPLGERCVNFGVPKIGAGYNNYYEIIQTPQHVVFLSEMAHDARIIPTDGRPHAPKDIQLWNGDPRGRWEGDTLVIESTNFSPKSQFMASRENLHLVERFTRVGPDTLNYEITVTDSTTWVKPWTAMIPLKRTDNLVYEYACHEANHSMVGILRGARTLEQEAAEAARGRKQ